MRAGWIPRCSVVLGLAGLLAGCGGGLDFTKSVRVPTAERHVLAAESGSPQSPLKLPEDRPFNIHVKRSQQAPGVDGSAQGRSNATREGHASCQAEAAGGGTASAEFTLGHRFEHRADVAHLVDIELSLSLVQEVRASARPARETVATASLILVIVDSRKNTVAQTQLVNTSSDDAMLNGSVRDQRRLSVRFEPGLNYDIMLHGRVSAAAADNQEATAQIEIKQLTMHLAFSPAPETQPAQE